jgi:hypothetical protein
MPREAVTVKISFPLTIFGRIRIRKYYVRCSVLAPTQIGVITGIPVDTMPQRTISVVIGVFDVFYY